LCFGQTEGDKSFPSYPGTVVSNTGNFDPTSEMIGTTSSEYAGPGLGTAISCPTGTNTNDFSAHLHDLVNCAPNDSGS